MRQENIKQLTALLAFTNQLSDEAIKPALRIRWNTIKTSANIVTLSFASDMITDANREGILKDAERSACRYAESRSKRGTIPRAIMPTDESVANAVKGWVERRRFRLRGHQKQSAK